MSTAYENESSTLKSFNCRIFWAIVLSLGALLRFWGIEFGLPFQYRPDEECLVQSALAFQGGDLNPHFFIYPSLFMYLLGIEVYLFRLLQRSFEIAPSFYDRDGVVLATYVLGRLTSACAGVLGIIGVYFLGRKVAGQRVGLGAALLLTLNFAHVRESHFCTTDASMVMLVTWALVVILRFCDASRLRDFLLAGFLSGFAISTKYPAGILGAAYLIAYCMGCLRDRQALLRKTLYAGAGSVTTFLGFGIGTPYIFVSWDKVKEEFLYQHSFVADGAPIEGQLYGAPWIFEFAFKHALGYPLLALSGIGIIFGLIALVKRERFGDYTLTLVAFVVCALSGLMWSRWVFFRYIVIVLPVLLVFASVAIDRFLRLIFSGVKVILLKNVRGATSGGISSHERGHLLYLFICALFALPGGLRAVQTDRLLTEVDTRTIARNWIDQNIPAGSEIGIHVNFFYGKPKLPDSLSYKQATDYLYSNFGDTRYLLFDSYPITYFSPGIRSEVRARVAERATLLYSVTPFREGYPSVSEYDLTDAFYLPLSDLDSVTRPGPRIDIFELR